VNSAAQRARATLRQHLPERRLEWAQSAGPTEQERAVLRRYMQAVERSDLEAVAGLLAADVRATMPPFPMWFQGRDAVMASLAASSDPASPAYVGRLRMVPVGANREPRQRPTSGAPVTTSTGRSRSACCGSPGAASRRSRPSTTPACSRRSACPRRCRRGPMSFPAIRRLNGLSPTRIVKEICHE
jgi:SnoaL-like domain